MFSTRLAREYGVEFPFVSAGMGFIALPELVAAVSNAGGLGLLGWSGRDDKTPPQPEPGLVIGQTDLFGHPHPMPKFSVALPTPETTGDFEQMCMAAGRGVGLVGEVKFAGEIVREMMTQASECLRSPNADVPRGPGERPAV
jgi:NAD(P)H-dependent flavin oxidoreductase YrpB (nitropropane dioxygenase family)